MRAISLMACLLLSACDAGSDGAVDAIAADAEATPPVTVSDPLDIYEESAAEVSGAAPPE